MVFLSQSDNAWYFLEAELLKIGKHYVKDSVITLFNT